MVLSETIDFAQDVWIFRRPFRLVGVSIGLTMTVIRLANGELFVHSPVRLTDEIKKRLESLGRVRFVIAPSTLHHLFIRDYGPAFPEAKLYALPSLKAKRADIYFHGELSENAEPGWASEIDQIALGGLKEGNEELAFFHKASKTAIVTDLVFNLTTPHSLWEKAFFILNGLGNGPKCSRVFRTIVRNKAALRKSVDQILAWKPERLIVGHGLPVQVNAEKSLRDAFTWLRG